MMATTANKPNIKNVYNSVNSTDIELKPAVVEADSHNTSANTSCERIFLQGLSKTALVLSFLITGQS